MVDVAPLRVVYLGAGPRTEANAEALVASGAGRPVGFWNRTAPAADRLSERYCITARHDNVESLVAAENPDLVAIVTHPSARAELVEAAVAGGARALVIEKPIALGESELRRIERAARDCFVVVNTQYRWMTQWRELFDRVARGEFGSVRTIRASTRVDILEQGPHLVSLALGIARAAALDEPEWVLAGASGDLSPNGVPADLVATVGLGEARLSLNAGPTAPAVPGEDVIWYQQQVEVVGSAARAWVSLNQGWELWNSDGLTSGATAWPRDDVQSQQDFSRDLAAAVRDPGLQDNFPTRLAVSAVEARLLFACIRSANEGRRVMLEEVAA
jgi:predicted dehydrogenase